MKRVLKLSASVLCLAAAFLAGRHSLPDSSSTGQAPGKQWKSATEPGSRRSQEAAGESSVASHAVPGQPNEALVRKMRATLRNPSVIHRLPEWMQLLKAARAEDMPALFAIIEENGRQGRYFTDESAAFWTQWGLLNGPEALGVLSELKEMKDGQARFRVAQAWASREPAAALAWIKAHPDAGFLSETIRGAIKGWAEQDIAAATAHILSLPPEDALRSSQTALDLVWTSWHGDGPEGTAAWFQTLANDPRADGNLKNGAFSTLLEAWGRCDDISAAAAFVKQHLGTSYCDSRGIQRLVSTYAAKDPGSAVTFIGTLAAGPSGNLPDLMAPVISEWVSKDADAPGLWLQNNSGSAAYDQVAAQYARSIYSLDPDAATQWSRTIKDPALREQTIGSLTAAP